MSPRVSSGSGSSKTTGPAAIVKRLAATLVTAITGLEAPEAEVKALLKQLKAAAGTGGTVKYGVIELQGDQVAPALAALEKAGYRPKQAGG